MARENTAGLGVNTRYGGISIPDGARGGYHTANGMEYIVADWSAGLLNSDSINTAITIVKGVLPVRAWIIVDTAMSLSGSSASFGIGVQGSFSDRADITGTAVPVSIKAMTLLGKFSTGLTATATLVLGMSSGSMNEGAGRLVVECIKP